MQPGQQPQGQQPQQPQQAQMMPQGQPMYGYPYGYQYPYGYPQQGMPPAQPGAMPPQQMPPQPGMPMPQYPPQQYPPQQYPPQPYPQQPYPPQPYPQQPYPMQQYPPQPGMMQPGMMPYGQPGVAPAAAASPLLVPRQGPITVELRQISQADAEAAASTLYGAFKGLGANHSEVIKVLASHNKVQLNAIAQAYFMKYGSTLESRVKSELTGNYEKLALAILNPPYYMESSLLKKAILNKENIDTTLIAGILCARTGTDIQQIVLSSMEFKRTKPGKKPKTKKNLSQEILKAIEGTGQFYNLIRALFTTRRETGPANPTRAASDAKDLIIAAKGIGCDVKTFISIMTSRSYAHIEKISQEVEAQKKQPFKKLIYHEFTGVMEIAFATLLFMAKSPAHAVAYVMYRAMKGLGTDDTTLIACIAYIYDNDLLDKVKVAFKEVAGKDLVKWVESETSLNYKKLCVSLLNYKGKKHVVKMNNGY